MSFERLYKRLSPILKGIAHRLNGRGLFIDQDDLYQEMCIYLWKKYSQGKPEGINDAYIIQGCKFHVLNYLRKNRDSASLVSLEQAAQEYDRSLEDILPTLDEPLHHKIERRLTFAEIRNNGFSPCQKQVLNYLAQGLTIREVGKKLGISHVMVLKHKKALIHKWQHKYSYQRS